MKKSIVLLTALLVACSTSLSSHESQTVRYNPNIIDNSADDSLILCEPSLPFVVDFNADLNQTFPNGPIMLDLLAGHWPFSESLYDDFEGCYAVVIFILRVNLVKVKINRIQVPNFISAQYKAISDNTGKNFSLPKIAEYEIDLSEIDLGDISIDAMVWLFDTDDSAMMGFFGVASVLLTRQDTIFVLSGKTSTFPYPY